MPNIGVIWDVMRLKSANLPFQRDSTPFKSDNLPVISKFRRDISVIYDIMRRKVPVYPKKSDFLPVESNSSRVI